jgi:hypothetical protein
VGYPAILIYDQSRLAWKYRRKPDIGDLPIVPASMRATYNYARRRKALREIKLKIFSWSPAPGNGWHLIWRLIRLNYVILLVVLSLVAISFALSFAPAFFFAEIRPIPLG